MIVVRHSGVVLSCALGAVVRMRSPAKDDPARKGDRGERRPLARERAGRSTMTLAPANEPLQAREGADPERLVAIFHGRLHTRNYEKDGQPRVTIEILVSDVQLLDRKSGAVTAGIRGDAPRG
jgi:hypothetical protein